jgi:alkylation response protein AidB-like acyl-CoA dehydrogenase
VTTPDERNELAAAIARLLMDRAPVASLAAVADTADGYDRSLWRELAGYGFLGLLVPEWLGGAGGCLSDASVVATELGRQLVPGPFATSAVAATTILVEAAHRGSAVARIDLLGLVEGTATATVLNAPSIHRDLTVTARPDGAFVLDGSVEIVVGADSADALIVPARARGTAVILRVPSTDAIVTPVTLADVTRRAATVDFAATRVASDGVLLTGDEADAAVALASARLSVALAADCAGGANAALVLASEYAKTRHQFGRAIGSFQAIKHKLANMYIAVDSAEAIAHRAAVALDEGEEGASALVLAAAAHCSAAYVSVAGDAIQTHGGIGFTWEHLCHRFFKRAWLNEMWLGGSRSLEHAFAKSLFTEELVGA